MTHLDIPQFVYTEDLTPKQAEVVELFKDYGYEKIFYTAVMKSVHPDDWDDIYNNAAFKMLRAAEDRKNDSNLVGWCYRILERTIIDYQRKQGKQRGRLRFAPLAAVEQELVSMVEQPNTHSEQQENLDLAWEWIESLPPKYGVPFFFHHFNGMSADEIAEMTGTPERTVQHQIKKAKSLLSERARRLVVFAFGFRFDSEHVAALTQQAVNAFISEQNGTTETIIGAAATGTAAGLSGSKLSSVAGPSTMGVLACAGLPFLWIVALFTGGYHAAHALIKDAPTLEFRRWTLVQLIVFYCLLALFPAYYLGAHAVAGWAQDYEHSTLVTSLINWIYAALLGLYLYWLTYRKKCFVKGESCRIDEGWYRILQRCWLWLLYVVSLSLGVVCLVALSYVFLPKIVLCYAEGNWQTLILAILLACMTLGIFAMHFGMYSLYEYFFNISDNEEIFEQTRSGKDVYSGTAQSPFFIVAFLSLLPSISHLLAVQSRLLHPGMELGILVACWVGVYIWNRKSPASAMQRIVCLGVLQVGFMIFLRDVIFV